ncbi:MAG: hypothetical protein SGPRY_003655, partial [Prymnesium sp.]
MRADIRELALGGFSLLLDDSLVINFGGFGVVLRASLDSSPLALKLMVASSTHVSEAAEREAAVLFDALPAHAHVVRLISHETVSAAQPAIRLLCHAISTNLSSRTDNAIARGHRIHLPLLDEYPIHLLAYELLKGSTLFEIVSRSRLPIDEAREIFSQLAEAVGHCHAHSIAHLDLKLENALLEEGG